MIDPNLIPQGYYQAGTNYAYSANRPQVAQLIPMEYNELSRLRKNLGYQQAGPANRRRMEDVTMMGFPSNTDPNAIIGYKGTFIAPIQQPFGSHGAVGGPQSGTGKLEKAGRGLGPVLPRSQRERQEVARMETQAEATRRELSNNMYGFQQPENAAPISEPPAAIFARGGYAYTTSRGGENYDTSSYPKPSIDITGRMGGKNVTSLTPTTLPNVPQEMPMLWGQAYSHIKDRSLLPERFRSLTSPTNYANEDNLLTPLAQSMPIVSSVPFGTSRARIFDPFVGPVGY